MGRRDDVYSALSSRLGHPRLEKIERPITTDAKKKKRTASDRRSRLEQVTSESEIQSVGYSSFSNRRLAIPMGSAVRGAARDTPNFVGPPADTQSRSMSIPCRTDPVKPTSGATGASGRWPEGFRPTPTASRCCDAVGLLCENPDSRVRPNGSCVSEAIRQADLQEARRHDRQRLQEVGARAVLQGGHRVGVQRIVDVQRDRR